MRTRILGAWLIGALPLVVPAQTAAPDVKGAPAVGGVATIDYVTLRAGNLGSPLRFGHVIPSSEQIQLSGRLLASGADYGVDYETGVVYLKTAQRSGDQMVVSYRYDPQGKSTGASFVGVNSFSGLSLAPGLGLVGGLGLAERAADGSVISNNVFGWNNSLKFGADGKTSFGGVFLYADRQKNDNQAGLSLEMNAKPGDASTETGASQFLLQNFRSALLGGNFSVDYQDISKNFTSAGQVRAAGFSDADTVRLMKERGLKRQGASLTGMKFGGATVSASFRQVDDDAHKGIDWSSYALQQGGLKLSMSSQRVQTGFARFGDLSEGDRDQLAKEVGLSRQNLAGEFAQRAAKLSFSSSDIADEATGTHAVQRQARLDTGKIGLQFGDQSVSKDFARVGSLTGDEQGLYGRAVGTERQWMGLTAALGGKAAPHNLAFNELDLKNGTGRLAIQDASYQGKTWTLDHVGFAGKGSALPTGALQDAEANNYTKRLGGFFNTPATNDGQRGQLLGSTDVKRDLTKIAGGLGKGASFAADRLKFGDGGDKGGTAESVTFSNPKVKATYSHQDFGAKFSDAARLVDFERARLGSTAGIARTDVSFGVQIDKARSFSFGQTQAKDATGDVGRTTLAYSAKGLNVTAGHRDVSKGFASAAALVDPENSLLAQFQGFRERDLGLDYSGTPGLRVKAFVQDASNDATQEARAVANADVAWQVDKLTNVGYVSQNSSNKDPLTTLFDQSLRRMSLTHSFGTLATFSLMDERVENGGTNNPNPDSHKQYLALEAHLDKTLSVKTEQTRTDFSDGNKEDISANTVSKALSKNVGVSVTKVSIDRKGDDQDEKRTNYGFWYDLGKGLRFNYGFVQNSAGGTGNGTEVLTFGQTGPNTLAPNATNSVGQSNVGGILVGGGYGTASTTAIDPTGTHTQSFANFGLATAKPLAFGGFSDLKFGFSLDQAADYSQYVRENRTASISGKMGKNAFAFGYRGQLANPNLAPNATTVGLPNFAAIDRSVSLTTDPSPKATLVINGSIKQRDLPGTQDYTSRNFAVTARPLPGVEVTNQVQTNLEQANPNVLLGSTLLADRGNKWTLGYRSNGDTSVSASWEEKANDTTNVSSTLSAVNLTLFQKCGSPLRLTYGVDDVSDPTSRHLITRYSLQFDARATASQTLSLYVGNTDYAYNVPDPSLKGDNWTFRMNYQIRF